MDYNVILFKYILETLSSLAIISGTLLALIASVYGLYKYLEIKVRRKIELEMLFAKVDNIFDDVDKMTSDIDELKNLIEDIWKDRNAPPNSLRQLNIRGKEILSVSKVSEVVKRNTELVAKLLSRKQITDEYDLEQAIADVFTSNFFDFLSDEDKIIVKNSAYETGESVRSLMYVASIYYRNNYLHLHA